MRAKWKKSISMVVSSCLIISSVAFTENFSAGSQVCAVAAEAQSDVDTETEFTDDATGCKYKLYITGQTVNAEITGYVEQDGALVIPAKVGTAPVYEVKRIAKEAFKESSITSVDIAEGIEEIGYQSFAGCKSLKSAKIPPTITNWKEESYLNGAFMNCTALETVELAEGLTKLGQEAFHGCKALTSVEIPSTITFFPSYVFWGCSSLVNVKLSEGITQMGYQAFRECTSLKEVKIPSTIKTWNTIRSSGVTAQVYDCGPFWGCTALEKVTFAEGLTTLSGFQGVRGCPLVKELDIPASVTNIERAFANCAYLEKVTLHDGLETIGTCAFEECSALQEVVIPETVTKMDYRAFYKCTSMKKLVFPPGLVTIDNNTTWGCSSLKELYILAPSMQYKSFGMAEDGKYYCIPGSNTYSVYYEKEPEKTAEIQALSGIEAKGYTGVYDANSHDALTKISGILEGDLVLYRMDGTDGFQSDIPQITEPGTYTIDALVRTVQNGEMQVGIVSAEAEIRKKESSILLKNMEVTGGEYTMQPESYVGDEEAEIIYSYYTDEALSVSCDRPTEPGIYYVKAEVAESTYYLAGESNVVTLTITGKTQPTQEPTQKPTQEPTQKPEQKPDSTPGSENSPIPSSSSSVNATVSPAPGATMTPAPKPTAKVKKTPNSKVKKVTLKKVKSPSKKKIEVRWKKVSGVTGYQVTVGLNKKFKKGKKTVTVKGASKTKAVVKNVKRKKWYYVKVRAYKTVKGTKKYGQWSSVRRIKVK